MYTLERNDKVLSLFFSDESDSIKITDNLFHFFYLHLVVYTYFYANQQQFSKSVIAIPQNVIDPGSITIKDLKHNKANIKTKQPTVKQSKSVNSNPHHPDQQFVFLAPSLFPPHCGPLTHKLTLNAQHNFNHPRFALRTSEKPKIQLCKFAERDQTSAPTNVIALKRIPPIKIRVEIFELQLHAHSESHNAKVSSEYHETT